MKKGIKLTAILALVTAMMPISSVICLAEGETTIKVEEVIVEEGGSVDVPIELSNNTGICGATISISYDSRLTLTAVNKGTALASLAMTKPGKLTANPITIPWDGLDADTTNGSMAVLTFTVPDTAGDYNVSVSYGEGDIVDGDLNPVDVAVVQGKITVKAKEQKIIAQNLGVFTADAEYEGDAVSATAFKADLSSVNGVVSITITPENGEPHTFTSVTNISNSDVVLGIIVSGLADENAVGEISIN